MTVSNSDLVYKFYHGATDGKSSRMFIEDDIIYSYGYHFPLLVKTNFGYVLNSDKYSITTSKHQSLCRYYSTIEMPFSLLEKASILKGYSRNIQIDFGIAYNNRRKIIIRHEDKYYLCGTDGNQYVIYQLPKAVSNVEEAYKALKPQKIKDDNYIRQGRMYFVKADKLPINLYKNDKFIERSRAVKKIYNLMEKEFVLPQKIPTDKPYTATRGMVANGDVFVSGMVRHTNYSMIKLSKSDNPELFLAYEGRALGSWSTND